MNRKIENTLQRNFTNRLEGRNTGLSTKINLNGYYHYLFKDEFGRYKFINKGTDTMFQNVMFYEDGTFVKNVALLSGHSNYGDYFNSIIKNGKQDFFYTTASIWGIYSISGDTIKAQHMMYKAIFTPLYTGEEWYLIKDKNSIQLIFFKSDINQSFGEANMQNNKYVKSATLATFHPLDNIPPPLSWLKTNKFFWRNENDWAQYMKSVSE